MGPHSLDPDPVSAHIGLIQDDSIFRVVITDSTIHAVQSSGMTEDREPEHIASLRISQYEADFPVHYSAECHFTVTAISVRESGSLRYIASLLIGFDRIIHRKGFR